MAVGDINYYVLKPWITPDELFHRVIAEFVMEWSRSGQRTCVKWSSLQRNTRTRVRGGRPAEPERHPARFRSRASEPRSKVLEEIGHDDGEVMVWMPALGGTRLVDPTDAGSSEAWGIPTTLSDVDATSIC